MYVGYNTFEYRSRARQIVPRGLFEFIDRGAEDEVALRNNRAQLDALKLVPRVLRNTAGRSTETVLFGKRLAMPLAIGPTGAAGLLWHDGELALAKAAAKIGVPFTLSTGSLTSMERIAAEGGGIRWFQLYVWPDKSRSHALIERAAKAGHEALLVTLDLPVAANREYNQRSGFAIPFRITRRNFTDILSHPRWLTTVLGRYLATTGMPRYQNYPTDLKQPFTKMPLGRNMPKTDSLSWNDLADIRRIWPKVLIAKGILHPADAEIAIENGIDGIIVSNHGGRALDAAISPIEALPAIVAQVRGRVPVLMDGAVMRGSDIVKAVALGASAVLVGRATLYGIAVAGEEGAARVLGLLKEEADHVMAMIGCRSITDIGRECVLLPGERLQHGVRTAGAQNVRETGLSEGDLR